MPPAQAINNEVVEAAASSEGAGLADATKQQIRKALEAIAATPDFNPRAAQRLMIAEVAKTLAGVYEGERVLCVEGPTGTGKSLGYLLPAIPVAQAREKTLVIATATVALQEQLVDKDLPDLQSKTGMDFSFALAKGRRRYVCDRNLERLADVNHDQEHLDFGDDEHKHADWGIKPEDGEVEHIQNLWDARQQHNFSGDLDEWPKSLRSELKQEVTTDRNGCTGKSCPFYTDCAFFTERRKRDEKDVIVANHALVMADLMLGGGVVLPAPEDCIYIFDEGHHLPDVAISQGAAATRLIGPQSWLSDLTKLPGKAVRAAAAHPDATQAIQDAGAGLDSDVQRLNQSLSDIHRYLRDTHPSVEAIKAESTKPDHSKQPKKSKKPKWKQPDPICRFAMGRVPDELRVLFGQAHDVCGGVYDQALKLNEKIRKAVAKAPDNRPLGTVQSSAQWICGRLDAMHHALSQLAASGPERANAAPVARWIECVAEGSDFSCCASPTSAAHLLRAILWEQCDGAIVTSATLASLGRFDRYFEQAGLGEKHGTQAIRLSSPFDYANNAQLVIPAMQASAKKHDEHTAEIVTRIDEGLIDTQAGTLVLFASYRQMKAVAEGVAPHIAQRILMQGSAPRHELLDTHRGRIDAGEGSILFGVASFSEGVDLPGAYCTHVIIAKIPFAVPDSPVDATLSEWLESRGRNPFMELSVPEASFKLTQAAGRLLRTESDTGRVTVLDRRLADMPYGRMMVSALPPFRRIAE